MLVVLSVLFLCVRVRFVSFLFGAQWSLLIKTLERDTTKRFVVLHANLLFCEFAVLAGAEIYLLVPVLVHGSIFERGCPRWFKNGGCRRGLVPENMDETETDGLGKWRRYTPGDVSKIISLAELLPTTKKKTRGKIRRQQKQRKTRSTFA